MIEARPWCLRPATCSPAGGGHVSRCVALGRALLRHAPVEAVLERGGEVWTDKFRDNGITVVCEDQVRRSYAGIVLDDYELGADDVASWRVRTNGPLVQIEDFGAPLAGIDLAVNATPGLSGERIGGVAALLGPSFAMLAEPYENPPAPVIRETVERVVVGIGLNDQPDATSFALAAISTALPGAKVDLLLGSHSPNVSRLAERCSHNEDWTLHLDCKAPWEVARRADVAISGGGQSLLERLALGIPCIGFAVVDNQRPALAGAAAVKAVIDLGLFKDIRMGELANAIRSLAQDRAYRTALSSAAKRLVDGKGAARVAAHLAAMTQSKCRFST